MLGGRNPFERDRPQDAGGGQRAEPSPAQSRSDDTGHRFLADGRFVSARLQRPGDRDARRQAARSNPANRQQPDRTRRNLTNLIKPDRT